METTTDKTFGDVPAGKAAMAVMGQEGDVKTIWDRTKPEEVAMAREQFDKLKGKGYAAFKVTGKDGVKGEQMHSFDADAERIIFAPQMVGG